MARNFLPSLRSPKDSNLHGYYLPKALLDITIANNGGAIHLKINGTDYVQDPDQHYYFQYRPSAFTDDDITICYGTKGFLSKVHTIVDDQTDEFISKVFDIGETIATAGMPGVNTRSIPLFSGKIDPFNEDDLNRVTRALKQADPNLSFEVNVLGKEPQEGANPADTTRTGIYVKPKALTEIVIAHPQGREVQYVELPHPQILQFIEIPTAPWVKTEFEMDFDENGFPTTISVKKPSSAMAIIEVPLKIIRSIIALPSQLVQFRLNYDNTKLQSLQSRYTYQQQLLQYEENMQKLELDRRKFELEHGTGSSQNGALGNNGSGSTAELESLKNDIRKLQQDLELMRKRANA